MFRLYLSKEVRLHVWDSRYSVPRVTTIHTHPWDFESKVISGAMVDIAYRKEPSVRNSTDRLTLMRHFALFNEQKIICGPGGCVTGDPIEVSLYDQRTIRMEAGETYTLRRDELHESVPEDGTVTVIRRKFYEDTEHAYVYYLVGTQWVSAEPRKALPDEIASMSSQALSMLDL